jgi:hypothetical protein
MPIESLDDNEPSLPESMSEQELEGLLHFAIRHSNLDKLREMAESGQTLESIRQETAAVVDAMYATDNLFRDTVREIFQNQSTKTTDEWLAAIEFIDDYGDHLLDKGDLLDGLGALEILLDLVMHPSMAGNSITWHVYSKLADLVVSITQNREETKRLVMKKRPKFVNTVFKVIQGKCLQPSNPSPDDDEVCASLISVITAMINGDPIESASDEEILCPLAKNFPIFAKNMVNTFSRLITLFRVAAISGGQTQWRTHIQFAVVDSSLLPNHVQRKFFELVNRLDTTPSQKCTDNCDEFRDEL